jgi:cytochrome c oxidase subunit II
VEKGWSYLFGGVLGASFALFAVAPFTGWWLPENVASYGGEVDLLFYVILILTGFFFVLTEVILVWAMYKYVGRPGAKSSYSHGNQKLELLWTLVPAAILVYIAVAQISAWERIKYLARAPMPDQLVQVYAHQWEWRMRYSTEFKNSSDGLVPGNAVKNPDEAARKSSELQAAAWAEEPQADDLHIVNELHTWKGAKVKIYLKTHDVIHSFFLPNLRFKQDTLPGKTIIGWTDATKANARFDEKTGQSVPLDVSDWKEGSDPWRKSNNQWEIACAELCGSGHFRMRGRIYVYETKEEYLRWRNYMYAAQQNADAETTTLPK